MGFSFVVVVVVVVAAVLVAFGFVSVVFFVVVFVSVVFVSVVVGRCVACVVAVVEIVAANFGLLLRRLLVRFLGTRQ